LAVLETNSPPRSVRLLRIVLVALALRLAVMGFVYPEHLNPERDHWYFGGETGHIARSLVEGKGFSSPMFADTGPTAWQTPIYPSLLALVFRVFGVFTKGAAISILSVNSLFSSLTCLPVFFITRRTFGEKAAWRAAWAWAFFPYAIFFAASHIWPTTLTTLLLSVAFLAGLQLEDLDQVRPVERSSSYERPSRPYSLAATRTVDVLPRVAAQGQLAPARSGGRVGLCGCRLALVHTKLPRFS
jgi:asparagine N-glycosylation enzyme membrane subunit Stt3